MASIIGFERLTTLVSAFQQRTPAAYDDDQPPHARKTYTHIPRLERGGRGRDEGARIPRGRMREYPASQTRSEGPGRAGRSFRGRKFPMHGSLGGIALVIFVPALFSSLLFSSTSTRRMSFNLLFFLAFSCIREEEEEGWGKKKVFPGVATKEGREGARDGSWVIWKGTGNRDGKRARRETTPEIPVRGKGHIENTLVWDFSFSPLSFGPGKRAVRLFHLGVVGRQTTAWRLGAWSMAGGDSEDGWTCW
ncbi:hypothetical protein B0T11DRAFT_48419 [Plectosphaerella cucumerina]|uniref:Uncharacterized protein n=1 Tax=Plectosphaerella cucumerina TaxID=40658 RepID=A0A8K0X4J8_9PEZI|nr:hypothetical protein B0T11DRAFT_48419 [Plectosphaerella cucumerina]